MRRAWLAMAAAWAIGGAAVAAPPVPDVETTSHRAADGRRATQHRVVVPAARDDVWAAFATSEGFQRWAVPVANVDLRVGGVIESTYSVDGRIGAPGNIKNEIVALIPGRLMVFRNVQAPPGAPFDVPAFQTIQTFVELEALGPTETRVTLTGVGYGEGAAYDGVYKHFEWGNAWSLGKLRESFVKGPVQWPKATAEIAAAQPTGDDR
jgi:uncharacterized protein YndB with AHSA1/START domain